jgi:hypothetical protein
MYICSLGYLTSKSIEMIKKSSVSFPGRKVKSSLVLEAVPVIVFYLFLLCGFNRSALAQDVLTLKSGKELKAIIVEEGTDIIKYREFDNPAGPLYSISKDKVASVRYKKGSKDTISKPLNEQDKAKSGDSEMANQSLGTQPLTTKKRYVMLNGNILPARTVKSLMEDNPTALSSYEKGAKLCKMSNACAYGVIITSLITTRIENKKTESSDKIKAGVTGLVIDGAFIISAIVMATTGKKMIRNSVSVYNSSLKASSVNYKIDFGLQTHGIGLAMKF